MLLTYHTLDEGSYKLNYMCQWNFIESMPVSVQTDFLNFVRRPSFGKKFLTTSAFKFHGILKKTMFKYINLHGGFRHRSLPITEIPENVETFYTQCSVYSFHRKKARLS